MVTKSSRQPAVTLVRRTYTAEAGAIARGLGVIKGTAPTQVKIAGAAGRIVGVMEETTAEDALGAVVEFGDAIGIAGGAITNGDAVKTDAAGKWVTSAAEDVETGGIARSAAAALDDEFLLFVSPSHKRS